MSDFKSSLIVQKEKSDEAAMDNSRTARRSYSDVSNGWNNLYRCFHICF